MKTICAFDTETFLFRPGVMAPEMVCLTWETYDITTGDRSGPQIVHAKDALPLLATWLEDPETLLVGHYLQFDLAVAMANFPELIRPVFDAVASDRCTCTKWRMILLDVACGSYRWRTKEDGTRTPMTYDLDTSIWRYTGRRLDKSADSWRLRYQELIGIPVADWPHAARHYALEDARSTMDVYLAQEAFNAEAIAGSGMDLLASQYHEMRGYLGLQLDSCWGLRTDPTKVDILEEEIRIEVAKVQSQLVEAGFVREDGSRDLKNTTEYIVQVYAALGVPVPRNKPTTKMLEKGQRLGNVILDADACQRSDDDLLIAYARYGTLQAMLSKDVKLLRKGGEYPIHRSYGFAETSRTTASPNTQNFSRSNA